MPAVMIDGRALAQKYKDEALNSAALLLKKGIEVHLAVVLVGDDPASQTYVRSKERACERAGIRSTLVRLPGDCTQETLESQIRKLNEDQSVHGILVQLPLPAHLDENAAIALIDPKKDVDGFHTDNAGRLYLGRPRFSPCTPLGVMKMLEAYGIQIKGKHAVIVGRSGIVGKPMAMMLLSADATVTICHSKTIDLARHTRQADILIAAVGIPGFITEDMVKPGAVVIDVGINRIDGQIVGDVSPQAQQTAGYMTPVPGGVGQMTVAMLLHNVVMAAQMYGG